jgi:ABC-type ATPase with predicted acetyltransferase domain
MSLIRCHNCGDIIDSDAEPECFWIAGFGYRLRRRDETLN